jgi:hypothetical protein
MKSCPVIACLFAIVAAHPLSAATASRTVALSGQPAPGEPAGTVYRYINDPPTLNDAGQTAFRAALIQNGTDAGIGYFSERFGVANLAVDSRSLPANSEIALGKVDDVNAYVIEGVQAPGTPNGVTFHGVTNGLILRNDTGSAAFSAGLIGDTVNSSNDFGIWSDSVGSLSLVVREGDTAPGVSGAVFTNLGAPVFNDHGEVGFLAAISSTTSFLPVDGIWSGAAGNVNLFARYGMQAPGTDVGVSFLSFKNLDINSASRKAFQATLTGPGVTDANNTGLWSDGFGQLSLVARTGNHAPGTSTGVNFAVTDTAFLNAAGEALVVASVSGPGIVYGVNDSGLWMKASSDLHLVAMELTQAPGTTTGVKFRTFQEPAFNANGQIAFESLLTNVAAQRNGTYAPNPNVPLNDNNDFGIWATDINGALHLVARTGDLLEVAPSDFRTIRGLSFLGSTGNQDGIPSGFNDRGQLAFFAFFTDGSSGVFVSNVVAVPEPTTTTLLLLGMLGCGVRRNHARRQSTAFLCRLPDMQQT